MSERRLRVVPNSDINTKYPTWLVSYNFDGHNWSLSIPAKTWEEAEARLLAIGQAGKIDGKLIFSIPAFTGRWLPNLICGWNNFWKQLRNKIND
jgi:hypothetical protein